MPAVPVVPPAQQNQPAGDSMPARGSQPGQNGPSTPDSALPADARFRLDDMGADLYVTKVCPADPEHEVVVRNAFVVPSDTVLWECTAPGCPVASDWPASDSFVRALRAWVVDERSGSRAQQSASPQSGTRAERMRDHVRSRATKLVWDGSQAFVVIQEPAHVETFLVGSRGYRHWMIRELARMGDGMPSSEDWKKSTEALEAIASSGGVGATPSIRVAGSNDACYIDLGDDTWRCVRVTRDGWEIVSQPVDGPYMYRPPRQASLPEPVRGGDVNELWDFVNVVDPSVRLLLLAGVLQALHPQGPFPVIVFHGPNGSGKSVAMEILKALIDPTRPNPNRRAVTSLNNPPREARDVPAAAKGSWLVAYDNVSYLDEWLSDTLCRLSTGADMGGRSLFTDNDETIVSAIRPVMMNGIPEVIGKPDLADRAINVPLEKPGVRRTDEELWSAFSGGAGGRILGALLDQLVGVMQHRHAARLPAEMDVRMADFALLGEALCLSWGADSGAFTRVYYERRRDAASEIAEADPLTPRLTALLDLQPDGSWAGGVGELLKELVPFDLAAPRGKGWWTSPRALGNHLVRMKDPLAAAGIVVEKQGRGRSPISGRVMALYRVSRG